MELKLPAFEDLKRAENYRRFASIHREKYFVLLFP
jgi:hypothetical protein